MKREEKIELLRKIESGELKIKDLPRPIPERNYELDQAGLFRCTETGEFFTLEEIRSISSVKSNFHPFFYEENINDQMEVASIKQKAMSTIEQLTRFGQDEFLEMMKQATATL